VKRSRLGRHYDQLDPIERFRLTVASLARDDRVEAERLEQSCRRERHHACEAAFLDRLELARELVLVVIADLQRPLGKLDLLAALTEPSDSEHAPAGAVAFFLDWAAEQAAFAAFAASDGAQRAQICEPVLAAARRPGKRLLAVLDEIAQTLVQNGAAQAHGFARVCERELDIDPLLLVEAFAPSFHAELEPLLAAEPDQELAADYADLLADAVRERLGYPPMRNSERGASRER
jgi:hypothetical protein